MKSLGRPYNYSRKDTVAIQNTTRNLCQILDLPAYNIAKNIMAYHDIWYYYDNYNSYGEED